MHSNLFQLLVDTGIVGLGTWLSIWITYFIETFKRRRLLTDENGIELGLLTGSLAAMLGFLTGGFFESSFYDSEVTMLLYFLMGLSLAKVKKAVRVSMFWQTAIFIRGHGKMVGWFPDILRPKIQSCRLYRPTGLPTFPVDLFHDSPSGG